MANYKIVARFEDNNGRHYKIEFVENGTFTRDYYNVLYNNGDVMGRKFDSFNEAVTWLEDEVGQVYEI